MENFECTCPTHPELEYCHCEECDTDDPSGYGYYECKRGGKNQECNRLKGTNWCKLCGHNEVFLSPICDACQQKKELKT